MKLHLSILLVICSVYIEQSSCNCTLEETVPTTVSCNHGSEDEFKYELYKLDSAISNLTVEVVNSSISTEYLVNELADKFTNATRLNITISNSLIEYDVEYILENLKNIDTLNLNYNGFTSLSFFSAPLRYNTLYLSKVFLQSSTIPHLRKSQNFITVNELDLAYCNIHIIDRDAFENINGLQVLYLNDNYLRTLNNSLATIRLTYLDLSNNILETLTKNDFYPSSITGINLSNNRLSTIENFGFVGSINYIFQGNYIRDLYNVALPIANFKTLDLSDCGIHSMQSDTFAHMKIENALKLSGNEINVLFPYTFGYEIFQNPLGDPTELSLSNCSIRHISENTFNGLSNLTVLDISQNNMYLLIDYGFNNLRVDILDLSYSNISAIQDNAFYGLSVDILILTANKLTTIDFNGFCMSRTRHLILTYNYIETIGNMLCRNSIEMLDLSYNYLGPLIASNYSSMSDFGHFENLTYLNLSNNAISNLYPLFGKSFENIEILDLSHNPLRYIRAKTFVSLRKLNTLLLDYNNISQIHPSAFSNSVRLKTLYLTYNGELREEQFSNLGNVVTLSFSRSNITMIRQKTFTGMIRLKNLMFNNVTVDTIDTEVFEGLVSLETSDFHTIFDNILTLEHGMLSGLKSVEDLAITETALKVVQYRAFTGLDNLKTLSLADNLIDTLEIGCFIGLRSLRMLNLSDNALNWLEAGVFTDLINLEVLDISFNMLQTLKSEVVFPLFNLKRLDLYSNAFMVMDYTMLLRTLPSLKSIDVGGNLWQCNYLVLMLSNFTVSGVDYTPLRYEEEVKENINSIYCVNICKHLECSGPEGQHNY